MKKPRQGRRIGAGPLSRALVGVAAFAAGLFGATRGTQDAVANGDTRTITIHHTHTKETATVTFRRNGRYDSAALDQLNWLLRDWRLDEPTRMDPRLFDIVWEVYREVGSSEPIHVVSAYRSPKTNSMLRRRSRGVAKHSQHTLGKAMDFYLPDIGMDRVRTIGMRLQHGGVGYYPNAHNPFVHLDAGSVRAWPRMTHDQLARLFPSGKTVHIPSDGQPLPGYEEAKAEIVARGGSVAGVTMVADGEEAAQPQGRRKSFWASLFGGGDDEDAEYYASQPTRAAVGRGARPSSPQVAAYAPAASDDTSSRFAAMDGFRQEPQARRPAPARPAPRRPDPETETASLPEDAPVQASPSLPRAADPPAAAPARVASLGAAPAAPGPRLMWQQGAAAQAAGDAQAPAADRLSIVPLPPRRPDETPLGSLAFTPAPGIPIPPARPVELAYAGGAPLALGREPKGVADPAPVLISPAPPAPPPRPREASEGPTTPLQRSAAPADDRTALNALFAAAEAEPAPKPRGALALARVRSAPAAAGVVADPGAGLNLGFSQGASDLQASRFSGPAVKALPVRR